MSPISEKSIPVDQETAPVTSAGQLAATNNQLGGMRPVPSREPSKIERIQSRLSGTATHGGIRTRDFGFLPIPKNRRYDPSMKPEECFPWTLRTNFVFAVCSTVSVANLYYSQPMLVAIAKDFDVDYNAVAQISTLVQAGYGCGILLVSPLGDLVRRRQMCMLLMLTASLLSIGCALASSVKMLVGFSFLVGFVTVTPQICIPWTADLAPSNIRAKSMSITLSGLIVGLVMGRVLAGIISNFSSWRNVFWMAVALQSCAFGIEYLMFPDTPDKGLNISYPQVIWSMATYYVKYPTLTQAGICFFLNSAVFAGYWTTQTFLLTDTYGYNTLQIGLLGLLGLIGALLAPQWGKLVDRVVPWLGQLMGLSLGFSGMIIAFAGAERNVAAIAVSILLYDCGMQLWQVSSSYRVAGIDPQARARLNGCSLLCIFAGQTSGTAIFTHIYTAKGWQTTGGVMLAFVGTSILVLLVRGPHETGWVGWSGGTQLLKREAMLDLSPQALTEGKRRAGVPLAQGPGEEVGLEERKEAERDLGDRKV
ncbi:uncharacterized protein MKK02DRAFT_42260 [Dioszegia hungarica]|uniref:Membrane protein n=1 Tax=Dioszegia hungarica TaxID=4972 RepID=A0AA38HCS6_9TREE|nr:uncharacterized protein MKK02DRAFT_42260 [Dioszegia hungarica]KAI9637881.1 membrane protein [Dioszegia hungarica]